MESKEENAEIVKKISNFLKLPKAQRWICCEWFYSDIDKVIFESENDFSLCLKQSFPRLKTTKLRRKEWCLLRSLIGKPRRCSDAFFREERQMLEEKRQKIRLIQQRKVSEKELVDLKDLPQEIPLTLSIGHRVYSHITYPEEGVFLGTIAAVDPCEHTYRVVFDRISIGSQTVFDYSIKSLTPIQTIPIKAYIQTYRPKITSNLNATTSQSLIHTPNKSLLTPNTHNLLLEDFKSANINNSAFATSLLLQNDQTINTMIGMDGSPFKLSLDSISGFLNQFQTPQLNSTNIITNNNLGATASIPGILGRYPIRLLVMITRLNKILNVKREFVAKLNALNTEAEKLRANNEPITRDYQTNYAILVLDLDKLNKDLSDYLNGVQRYCEDLVPEFNRLIPTSLLESAGANPTNESLIKPESHMKIEDLKQKLLDDSTKLVLKLNMKNKSQSNLADTTQIEKKFDEISLNEITPKKIKSQHLIELITKLTSLLFQIREFIYAANSFSQSSTFLPNCSRLINDSIAEIKSKLLNDSNVELFDDNIQVHIQFIKATLYEYNKLHAFKYELDKKNNNDVSSSNDNLIEFASDPDEEEKEENFDKDINDCIENNQQSDETCDQDDDNDDDDDSEEDDGEEDELDQNEDACDSENNYNELKEENFSSKNLNTDKKFQIKNLKTISKNKSKRKRLEKHKNSNLENSKKILCSISD